MNPDSWIYRGFTSCNFDLWWKQNGGQDNDLRKTTWLQVDFFMYKRLKFGNSTTRFCNATSNFDECQYIHCLRAEFDAKHTKAPLSLTTRWKMEPDFGSGQDARYIALPLISRYHCLDPTNHDISKKCFHLYSNIDMANNEYVWGYIHE